jgi:hypothetical protein
MGGSKTPTSTGAMSGQIFAPKATLPSAKATTMQATLPTASDYAANKMAMPQMGTMREARQNYAQKLMAENQLFGEPEKERNKQLMAQLAQNAASGVSDAFSRAIESQKQATGAAQWASMQQQSQGKNGFTFQPDNPASFQLADDNRYAPNAAWVKALTDIVTTGISAYGQPKT